MRPFANASSRSSKNNGINYSFLGLLILFTLSIFPNTSNAQFTEQIGDPLNEAGSREYGYAIAFSSNGKVLAVADPGHDSDVGRVSIYRRNGFTWSKIGNDIIGPNVATANNGQFNFEGRFGESIAISGDGSVVAIGVPEDPSGGAVQVYRNNNDTWEQVGSDLGLSEFQANALFGMSVSLSDDGTVLAAGTSQYNKEITETNIQEGAGIVRIYNINKDDWTISLDQDIEGSAEQERFGLSIDISQDGKAMVIGALHQLSTASGIVKVYRKIRGTWRQVGDNIASEVTGDRFGNSVSISDNGSTIAIGAPNSRGEENELGYVQVFSNSNYTNTGSNWTQKGANLTAGTGENNFGTSIALSADGSFVAIASSNAVSNAPSKATIYEYENDTWNLYGSQVSTNPVSRVGTFPVVAMDATATLLALGEADLSSGLGGIGVVQVFGDCPEGTICEYRDVDACGTSFTTDGGHEIFEDATYTEIVGNTRTTYFIAFGKEEVNTEVFTDAVVASSGSMTYEAKTNVSGVLSFDNSQDYWVELNSLQDDLNGTSRSIFMWIKTGNVSSSEQILFGINPANSGSTITNLFIDNNGNNLETNDGNSNRNASFDVSGEVWNHVGYTYDANTNETIIYVNGIAQNTYTNNQLTTATSRYSLGQEFDNNESNHYNGDMAEVSVWNEALSGVEVRVAMREKITNSHPKYANLVGYYSVFGECNDDTAVLKDHSGKGNDGVMMNGFVQDFKNADVIEGFNSIGWYPNVSWKKDGIEIATTSTLTTEVASGSYEFTALSDFIQSNNAWFISENQNATTIDNLLDETLCEDDPITRTVTANAVNYLDFEKDEGNYVEVSSITDDLVGTDRSIFLWVKKESNVPNGDSYQILSIQGDDGLEDIARFYIGASEDLGITSNGSDYASNEVPLDTWTHVGYTYDATAMETKLYINGTVARTISGVDMGVVEGAVATLGMRYDEDGSSRFFDGKMAEITVWDKLLSEEEVTALMAAAPAHDASNLVAAYGTLQTLADNQLRDLTANGNNGAATHSAIFVSDMEESIDDYNASNNYIFSWKKEGTEFDTDAIGNITIDEGTTNYSVTYGTPFFQKTDDFSLSYTNLLPTQPISQTAGVTSNVTFQVDEIPGASYQWYERKSEWVISAILADYGVNKINKIKFYGDHIYVATNDKGLFISKDGGETWEHPLIYRSSDSEIVQINDVILKDSVIYVGSQSQGGLYYLKEGDEFWTRILVDANGVHRMESVGEKFFVLFSGRLTVFTLDNDGNYSLLQAAVDGSGGFLDGFVTDFFVDGQTIFIATLEGLSVSKDEGETFTNYTATDGLLQNRVNGVYASDDEIYLAHNTGLSISHDGGMTWTGNSSISPVYSVSGLNGDILVGSDGLYISYDEGVNFSSFQGAISQVVGDVKLIEVSSSLDVIVSTGINDIKILKDKSRLSNNSDNSATNQIQGATTHQLTINNLSLDENATEYFVEVTLGECTQASDDVTLTVLDVPVLTAMTPASGSTDVAIDTEIILTFSKGISLDNRRSIKLVDGNGNEITDISATRTTLTDVTLTINQDLEYATTYSLLMEEGFVVDVTDGSKLALAITDPTAFTFTTVCEPLILTEPEDQTGYIGQSATFSVPEVAGASYQWYEKGDGNWTTTGNHENGFGAGVIQALYADAGRIFAGTQGGLSISTDGGSSWTTVTSDEEGLNSSTVQSVYAEGEKIYVGTSEGLSISTDGGASWTAIASGANGFANDSDIWGVFAQGDKVYAATIDGGLSISSDGGSSWTTTTAGANGFANSVGTTSVYAEGDKVYAGTLGGGLSISNDGGLSWTTTTANTSGFANSDMVSAIYADGDDVYVITEVGLSISSDGGNSWTSVTSGQNGFASAFQFESVYADENNIYVGTDEGLSISSDGGMNWETITRGQNGFTNSDFVFSVYKVGRQVYAGTTNGLSVFGDQNLQNDSDGSANGTFSGATSAALTIDNLTTDFDQTEYFVVVTKGDCEETSNTVTLTVGEAPPEPPVITALSPADDEIDVAKFTTPSITFDKAISKGTGNIEIRKTADDQLLTTIAVNSVLVNISDKTATIRLGDITFEFGTEYYITIPEGAFTTADGGAFEGLTDKTEWSFTIIDAPAIDTITPADDATDVDAGINESGIENAFTLVFNREVVGGPGGGFGLYKVEGDELVGISGEVVGDEDSPLKFEDDNRTVKMFFVEPAEGLSTGNITPVISLESGTAYYIKTLGIPFEDFAISDNTTWNFTTAPAEMEISSLSPVDDATAINPTDLNAALPTSPKFSITFDQPIAYNNTNAAFKLFRASDDQLLASQTLASTILGPAIEDFSGLSFAFASYEFQTATEYYILMDAGMVKSKETEVEFAGITEKTTWSFTTAGDPFTYFIRSPSVNFRNNTNGPLNISDLAIGPIRGHFLSFAGLGYTMGDAGKIGLYSSDDDALVYEIDLANNPIAINPAGIEDFGKATTFSFDGRNTTFIIKDDVVLNSNTAYYWLIDEGILLNSEAGRFVGISDKTEWAFTTETVETLPLEITSTRPSTSETLDLGADELRLNFAENIVAGSGTLTIFKGSDDAVFETLNISEFTIDNSRSPKRARAPISESFELGETYYVQFPAGFIKSEDGTKSVAAIDDKTTFTFGTALADAIFESFFPAPGSTTYDVSKGKDFEVVLNEEISDSDLQPIGGISLYRASDNNLVKTIAYEGENDDDLSYPDGDDELEIDIAKNELEPDTEYYILIDDGLIVSSDEPRYHRGIPNINTWRFRTAALPTTPVITSTNPLNNASGVSSSANIQITFSENVRANTGNLIIHKEDGTIFETIAASSVSISAAKATINPTNNFDFSTTYYVVIDGTAFESSNGVAFAGIADENTWRFTTQAMPNTAPVASTQTFTGNLEVNQQLSGSYDYADADTDPEDGSVYQWFMADDADGNNAAAIAGATGQNYTLTGGEEGKFVALAITPFDGEDAGQQVFTSYQGPVVAAVIPTLVSTSPVDGVMDVATNTNLSFVLSEAVTKGTGSIRVTTAGGSERTFNVSSDQVTVSGTDVTINPDNDLAGSEFYTVTFDASAFVDSDGNNSAGLTSTTRWNFTTEDLNVAPEATGVSVNRSLVVSGDLDGSYTYSDDNGDAESGTTFQWYRADDINGTGRTAIAGATAETYTTVNDDDGKFLSFEVTPSDGTLTGTAVESAFFGPILVNDGVTNIPPAFTSKALTRIFDNEEYAYIITFEDLNNDIPTLTKTTGPDWLSVSNFELTGNPSSEHVGTHDIVLTLDDQNGGTETQEFTITVLASNTAPSVSGIEITGTTTIDQQLTGSYNFIDNEDDADNSSLKWYRADDVVGTNKIEITGANSATYTLTTADAGKFISFEVTPNDGALDGTVAESNVVGAVAKKIPTLTLSAITKTYGDADFDLSASTNSSGALTYAFDNDQTGADLNGSTVTLGNAGSITIDVSLAETADFQARDIQSTITINKKSVEFTATSASKAVGEDDPQLAFTVTDGSVIGSDEVVTLRREAGEVAGTYAMTFTEGADAANYDISTVDGIFSITQTALTITADAATKTYGTVDPDFTFNITSGVLASGDELSGIVTREEGEDVGTYALQSSLFNAKYEITFVPANLTIGKADLSISVDDQTRNFGEANPEFTLSYDGLTNGDTGADFDTPPVATTTATETSPSGTYDITLNTPADANYNITGTTNGTLTINDVDIALTIADVILGEDEGSATVTVVLDNAVSGGFTVDAATSDGTATAGTDYTAVAGETLTFTGTPGEQQSFEIAFTPELDEEADETLTVSLRNLSGTTLPIDITDQATVTIANDDVAANQFIITMETTSDNEEVNLPTTGSGYNYVIDWGDGTVEGNLAGDKAHNYATAGTYTLRITGDFPRIYFKGAEDQASDDNALKIKSVEQWGTNPWVSMNGAFEGAMNMVINATDAPDLSAVFSMEEMFSDCDALTNDDFTAWDVSNVTSMKEMFERTNNFNGDLSNWDVSNVIDMEQMFKDALAFNGDITAWNTGNVEDMNRMFHLSDQSPGGSVMSFNQNINGWDVSGVEDFSSMFEANAVFNQGLNNWNTSSAGDMDNMFRNTSTFNGDISDWDVSSVTTMNSMFANAAAFNQDLSTWDVGLVEDMEEMFDGATVFNADIRNWDVAAVTSMKDMFEDAIAFNANISGWTTTALTDMDGMFLRATAFDQDISGWNISGLTTLQRVFENADAFNQDLSGWNTSAITDMSSLFEEADVFNQDISGWNVSMVTDMGDMFLNAAAFDQSLAAWDMSSADDLEEMLSGSGLSVANYDATLTGWAAQTLQSGVTLGATGLEYCASLADRQSLIDDDSWTINGDAQACETVVTITDIGGVEDDGDITVTLTSSNTIIGGFTVDVSTADGTATAGTDYTAVASETITFAGNAGETQVFIISPTADSDDEPNETILVNMSNLTVAAGNTVDITDQGTVTIFNEDVAEAFFTTTWETTADNQSITIPTNGEGYNYRIDWGDGTIEKNQTGDATHAYTTAGTYTVKIVGSFPRIDFNNSNSNNSALLKTVEQWGTIEWQSMENAFRNVANLAINAPGAPDLSAVTSMRFMFAFATNFNDDISGWDVSNVTDMLGLFNGATSFNQDISGWDVSNVTNMAVLFSGASAFNQPLDAWNVGNVITMEEMFNNADAFNQDLNSWDVSKVEKFDHMFKQTDLFNGDITSWDVSAGTDFEEMFMGTKAFNQPIGNWNLANATKVRYMFQESEAFNQPLNDWRFPNLTSTEAMFRKSLVFNQDLNDWEMTNITRIDDMFEEAEAFNGNISDWDVSNVKNFDYAFDEAEMFNQYISAWDVSSGENFRNMFDEATSFNQDLSAWETGNGTNFFAMFSNATSFDQDISGWDVTGSTNMSSMLNNSGLSIANYDALLTAWAKQDVSSGITLGVTGLQYCGGSNGRQSLIDVKGWTIENDGISCATTVTIEDIMAAEDDGDITATLTSSSFVAGGFTVDVSTADGTAIAGEDYTAVTSETVTFFGAAGETQVFTISPIADINEEQDETLTVSMDNVVTDANNTVTVTDQATVTIQNDDAPAFTFTLNAQFRINQEITVFEVKDGLTYDYSIDWGDGTLERGMTGNGIHTYTSAGPFTVKISGDFPGFEMKYFGVETVEQWGDQTWQDLENAFFQREITVNATDAPDLSAGPSLATLFSSAKMGSPDLTSWDVSAVTNMSELFSNSDFNGDVSTWNVGNVTDMSGTFGSTPFNGDISTWNVGNVTTMRGLFSQNTAFSGDLSSWNMSSVTNTESMFSNADAFNGDISSWNVSNVTDMTSMFGEADLFNQDISSWDVSNVVDMAAMFSGTKAFNQPLDAWDVSNVITMEIMFRNADAFNQDLNSWNVSNVEKFDEMFKQTALFNGDITGWDVTSGQDFEEMFQETEAFNQPIGNWNLASATRVRRMFRDAEVFNQPINDWRFPNLGSLEQMFWGALVFNQDLNDWDVSNITNMASTFEEAESFNGNISNWDVSKVEDFDEFLNETPFNQDISGWDVSSAVDFGRMFEDSPNFNQDLSNWDMSKATDVAYMFESATSFDQDISSWQLTSVTGFGSMLKNSGLSIANYDAFLISIARQDVMSDVEFDVEGLQYCAGKAARQSLIDDKNWVFLNDSQSCNTTVTIADVSGNEDDGDITVTLASDAFVVDGFTVDVSTADGTATAGTDYTAVTSETITFAGTVGETQTFTITPTSDMEVEGNESLTVSMSNLVTGANNSVTITDQATVTIIGDDQPVVSFASTAAANSESTTGADIEVTLNQAGLEAVSVDYTISGTATGNGTDYTLASGTLSFGVGDVSETIGLTIINDDIVEADETVIVTLSNPSGASLGTDNVFTYTIEDEDQATVSLEAVSSGEGDGDITLTATLDKVVDGGFTVDLITAESSAIKGVDYTGLEDVTLTFAGTAGETQSTTISPVDDEIFEFDEIISVLFDNLANTTLDVRLTDVVEITIEDNDQAVVTIEDVSGNEDDGDITITLQLNKAVTGGFSVDVSTTDLTATAGTDYTALSAETVTFAGTVGETQTIRLSPVTDTDVEGNETLSLSMSNLSGTALPIIITDQATVTIVGDDQPVVAFTSTTASNGESTTSADIEVTLNQAGLSTITVDYIVTGTATGSGTDHALANGTLNFASGDQSELIKLTIIDDALIEENETVIITLSNPAGASLGTNTVFTYTIVNNDARVTIEDVSQFEDGESFLVTAMLEGEIAGGFTVDLSTSDGTATLADGDYTEVSGTTLTFSGTDGETKTLDIAPGVDAKLEADETFTVSLSNLAGTTADVVTTDQATLTIRNDDAAAVTIADASGNEGDGPIMLTATLDNAVQGGFTVNVSTTDGTATIADSDYTPVSGQTLTFVGTAGETQTFTVSPTNDLVIEADETLAVVMSGLSTALAVDITNEATVTITNDDFNNTPTDITLSATSIDENEAMDALIGSLSTTDADAGDTHTYSLVTGTGSADNDFFILDGNELKANNISFNFEDRDSYSIRLQSDDGKGGLFAKAFAINISNVNETPFALSLTNSTIDEADDAQEVGMFMSLDPDNGDTFSYTLIAGTGDNHNDQFSINGAALNTAGAVNFEDGDTRNIRVRVTDAGDLSFEMAFTITIEDVVAEPVRPFTQNTPGADVKNVFSPNGDGVNETWVIEDLLDNPFNEVKIFAQGGKLIYSKVNYTNDWAGTFRDDPVPDGTYYYEITIFAHSGDSTPARVIKGFLTIIRNR